MTVMTKRQVLGDMRLAIETTPTGENVTTISVSQLRSWVRSISSWIISDPPDYSLRERAANFDILGNET